MRWWSKGVPILSGIDFGRNKMAKQVFYEDIEVGSEVPTLVKHPTTRQLVKWAGGGMVYACGLGPHGRKPVRVRLSPCPPLFDKISFFVYSRSRG